MSNCGRNTIIQELSSAIGAMERCRVRNNIFWGNRWADRITQLERLLPSGSGFDCGTKVITDRASEFDLRVDLSTEFHHIDDNGGYDGWTTHKIIVRPRFQGLRLIISGPDRNGIKEYIHEVFYSVLNQIAPEFPWKPKEI